jgi:hypothetical protein
MHAFSAKSACDTARAWSALEYGTPVIDACYFSLVESLLGNTSYITTQLWSTLATDSPLFSLAMAGSQYVMC